MKTIPAAIVAALAALSFAATASAEDVPPSQSSDTHQLKSQQERKPAKKTPKQKKHRTLLQKLKDVDLGHETAPGGTSLAPTPVQDAPSRPGR